MENAKNPECDLPISQDSQICPSCNGIVDNTRADDVTITKINTINLTKTIDTAAHIYNVGSKIDVKDGNSILTVNFTNMGYGAVVAVKFNVTAYNAFGEHLRIGGKDSFQILIQDIYVAENMSSECFSVKMPDNSIRKAVLEESQVCFADGKTVTHQADCIDVELHEIMCDTPEDLEIVRALEEKIPGIKYVPCELQNGWICTCGRYNHADDVVCTNCHKDKATQMYWFEPANIAKALAEKREADEQRIEQEKRIKLEESIRLEELKKEQDLKSSVLRIKMIAGLIIAGLITISGVAIYLMYR